MYRICRTNICTGWIFTMHANLHCSLRTFLPVYIVHMDHTLLPIRFAFSTGHLTGMTTNTALHVYEKSHFLIIICFRHNCYFKGLIIGFWFQVSGFRFQVSGFWFLVSGFWFLSILSSLYSIFSILYSLVSCLLSLFPTHHSLITIHYSLLTTANSDKPYLSYAANLSFPFSPAGTHKL